MTEERIAVVGLGYVGLPLAVALARHFSTVGIDIDRTRVEALRRGEDRTGEVAADVLGASMLDLATEMTAAENASVIIVTVPTPVDRYNQPDLRALRAATRSVASVLQPARGTIIVYESTVYPGVTDDICARELERTSGLKRGVDFFLGYSPERINPGDREHTVDRITKVVAGDNPHVVDRLSALYGAVTSGGIFRATSIKVAEAAKVIENAQRDINIAFMNEITKIFAALDLSIYDVLDAATTKWNFINFRPGLVGGHCIGVDPFYLSHLAVQVGEDPRIILSGRSINDGMGAWLADRVHELLEGQRHLLVLGLTFKENVPDIRNSRVVDIVRRLEWLGHSVTVHDPLADPAEAEAEYGIELQPDALGHRYDAVILAVGHDAYRALDNRMLDALVGESGRLVDIKGLWRGRAEMLGPRYWSL
jgi:UDP-N-acetyl-D-glucosamine/UDP-N-acetyl-D-galactosamine dehydrogenase